MSASRRLPRATGATPPPARRPRVAGLRKPAAPSPRPRPETPESTEPEEPEALEPAEVQEAAEAVEPPGPEPEALTPPEPAESETEAPKRPAPRRKVRDSGTAKPASEDEVEVAEPDGEPLPKRGFRNSFALVGVLLVVGLLFAGLAVFFQFKGSDASARTENTALLDVAGTAQVKQEMSSAAERLFSIDYNDIPKNEQAADELLVNDQVRQQYEQFMGELKRLAPEQQMVVTVKATRSAVVMLDDDRAKVMVYIDQTATRASDNQNSSGGAALWFTTEKRDGKWKVTDMDTYAAGQPTPVPPSGQQNQPPAEN
ncbi:hypothetical protein DI005_05015 [Prauserella sp. PE36]|uniref:hypothetical protein n=1 Tax=Prauserella sp. PE36 TaxID=1504709 RepID=UPI000DE3509D|nr:hypothetical protein [Prauserella sp. PE36]RBM22803.1 hypothetical protein DI005_05015 [Prauserella sp. PE36]